MNGGLSEEVIAGCDLESVLATEELARRPARASNSAAETRAMITLARELAKSPADLFSRLGHTMLELSNAESAGISLLNEKEKRFVWPAIAGGLTPYIGDGTPQGFGPCGTVLERRATLLFIRPDRYYTSLAGVTPPVEEGLLTPFYIDGKPVGTVWAVIHSKDRRFDAQDKRVLESLTEFASSAYRVLAQTGALKALLK